MTPRTLRGAARALLSLLLSSVLLSSCTLSASGSTPPPINPTPDPFPPQPPIPPVTPPATLTPRPVGSPDVLLLSVSGRCSLGCSAPADNWAYLGAPNWATSAQVASAFTALGKTVETLSVSGALSTHTSNALENIGRPSSEQGFLQLEAKFKDAYQNWILGRSNPTQIVLLAHSHGVNWTHQLARAYPSVPIAYLIDLDGISFGWESDNTNDITAYYAQQGKNPWPIALEKVSRVIPVRGGGIDDTFDVKDIVPNNVATNLEVRSIQGLFPVPYCGKDASGQDLYGNWLKDTVENLRPDGSKGGIVTYTSQTECHSPVAFGSSAGVAWVKARILERGL